jgi:hypothetical protein
MYLGDSAAAERDMNMTETNKRLYGSILRSWPLLDGRAIAEIDIQGSDRVVVCLTSGDRVAHADGGIVFNTEEVLGLRSKAYPIDWETFFSE